MCLLILKPQRVTLGCTQTMVPCKPRNLRSPSTPIQPILPYSSWCIRHSPSLVTNTWFKSKFKKISSMIFWCTNVDGQTTAWKLDHISTYGHIHRKVWYSRIMSFGNASDDHGKSLNIGTSGRIIPTLFYDYNHSEYRHYWSHHAACVVGWVTAL